LITKNPLYLEGELFHRKARHLIKQPEESDTELQKNEVVIEYEGLGVRVRVVVVNATFNNCSVIS
jgi:hypothetical protein